jgi:hypothetical protein
MFHPFKDGSIDSEVADSSPLWQAPQREPATESNERLQGF